MQQKKEHKWRKEGREEGKGREGKGKGKEGKGREGTNYWIINAPVFCIHFALFLP